MKQVYSYKAAIYISIIGIVLFSIPLIACTIFSIDYFIAGEIDLAVLSLIGALCFMMFVALGVLCLNRDACKVIYDCDQQVIYREGFICGYRYQLKVEDIKEIVIATIPKGGTYYILVDSDDTKCDWGLLTTFIAIRGTKYGEGHKKSFIRLSKTKENGEFIKQFWDKPMKEYLKYEEYMDLVK